MDKIQISKIHTVAVYDKKDYLENNKEINHDMLDILLSHENINGSKELSDARTYIEDLNGNMFLNELDPKIYVMYRENEPVSFAILNKIEKTESWTLDLIYTHNEWTKLGLATVLMRVVTKDLKTKQNAEEINSTVNCKNNASLFLHESFSKIKGVETKTETTMGRQKYHFDIRNLKFDNDKTESEDLLF